MRLKCESTNIVEGQLRVLLQSSGQSVVCAGGRNPLSGSRNASIVRNERFRRRVDFFRVVQETKLILCLPRYR